MRSIRDPRNLAGIALVGAVLLSTTGAAGGCSARKDTRPKDRITVRVDPTWLRKIEKKTRAPKAPKPRLTFRWTKEPECGAVCGN